MGTDEWRTIPKFPKYEVNREGVIRHKRIGRITKQKIKWNYYTVSLKNPQRNKLTTVFVHRCVAEAFIPNTHNYPMINHKDGNKLNNHVDNLEWCTCSMNIQHAYDTGLKVSLGNYLNRPVVQVDENNVIVERFPSIRAAEINTGIRHIGEVVNGDRYRKRAGGYYWRLTE